MKYVIDYVNVNYGFFARFYGLCDVSGCQSYFQWASIRVVQLGHFSPRHNAVIAEFTELH